MALSDTVRSAIAVANGVTSGLQVYVQHYLWLEDDSYGKPIYSTPVSRLAIVEYNQQLVRSYSGQDVMQLAKVTVLQPIVANGAEGRKEPVDPRDKFVLPDGSTHAILSVEGMTDPATGFPYMFQISLGGNTTVN